MFKLNEYYKKHQQDFLKLSVSFMHYFPNRNAETLYKFTYIRKQNDKIKFKICVFQFVGLLFIFPICNTK